MKSLEMKPMNSEDVVVAVENTVQPQGAYATWDGLTVSLRNMDVAYRELRMRYYCVRCFSLFR